MTITQFKGLYAPLSNFWIETQPLRASWGVHKAVCEVYTTEHSFQAGKADNEADFRAICTASTPGQAKRLGRSISCVPGWETRKIAHMYQCLRAKFLRPGHAHDVLLSTGLENLEEGNNWGDTFWGVDLATGRGENHLGRLLMLVRMEAEVAAAKGAFPGLQYKGYW